MNVDKTEPFDSNRITAGLGIKVGKKILLWNWPFINQMETGKTSNYGFIGFRNSFDWRKETTITSLIFIDNYANISWFLMIFIFMILIMNKKMTPLTALVIVPVTIALLQALVLSWET